MQPIFLLAQVPILLISVWMTMIIERLLTSRSFGYESTQYIVWLVCIFASVEYLAMGIIDTLHIPAESPSVVPVTALHMVPDFEHDPVVAALSSWKPVQNTYDL